MTPLCEIARKYGTDKGGEHFSAGDTCHAYTPVYYEMFKGRENDVERVLEIGINHGCSVRMWQDFFPYATIIGLDSNAECLRDYGPRVKCFAADQNSGQSLDAALTKAGIAHYDLIVDDGSHEFEHQVFSAMWLLPRLEPDGLYVIEDIHDDCHPEKVADRVMSYGPYKDVFEALYVRCPPGLGRAHCWCTPECKEPETLIVFRRRK